MAITFICTFELKEHSSPEGQSISSPRDIGIICRTNVFS